jgi:cytochrome c biogenesis protein CcdA/glutaredoxin
MLILLALTAAAQENQNITYDDNYVHLHLFYGQGCPHCGKLRLFMQDLEEEYPSLHVYEHEVYHDDEGREIFTMLAEKYGKEISGVPTVFIDDNMIVGFSNRLGEVIENEIMKCLVVDCQNPVTRNSTIDVIHTEGDSSPKELKTDVSKKLTVPIVISAAAVDAINPCAFAVLIILMTAALSIADKKKALRFGLAFTASIYISYFLMGLGLFSALQATGLSHGFYIFVTILALIVGILNVKDYFWYGKGFLMEIPLSWRPKMKKLLAGVTSPIGAFLVGFVVSLFELPCTGGPYIVILGLLAKEVTKKVGVLYLLLYNLVFISPLIILSIVIYKGLSTTKKLEKIRQKKIRVLHLIAGILMIGIASVMILSIYMGWV